ncbi:hypothetical protein M1N66_00115 [Thermodesulfovibrionales bacterium]|nr:hypothetical protein [Thermodesulfovibrionales bacterium]
MEALRKGHIAVVKESESVLLACEKASLPGVITQRSCPFYGARWFLAPLKDVIHLVHGAVGCAYYGQTVRAQEYQLASTDLSEIDIISGGEKKLYRTIIKAMAEIPVAKAVLVYATCSTGLIGDDLAAVCRQAAKDSGKRVVPVDCPGFSGVSQGHGHDLSASILLEHFIGREELPDPAPYDINLVGEFDVRGDTVVIKKLLGRLGVRVICTFTGDANVTNMGWSHQAKLNILHCRRTGKVLAEEMKTKYDILWRKVSFFGQQETSQALRDIADFFGLAEQAAQIITAEEQRVNEEIAKIKRYLNGKRVALYFGGSRMGAMVKAFRDLGMEVIMTGSQFSCGGDYQEAAAKVNAGTVLIDDANEKELHDFLSQHRPHLFVGGTKERFPTHKLGIPFLVFPQESSPFAAYDGFINFAREVFGLLKSPVWRLIAEDNGIPGDTRGRNENRCKT